MNNDPDWVSRGRTIRQLIQELQTFENQDLEVHISTDGGATSKCISLVTKIGDRALLKNCEVPLNAHR